MFKIPKKVKVGAYEYSVRVVKNLTHKGINIRGICDNDELEILIDLGLRGADVPVTFLHECLHAIDEVYGVKLGEKRIGVLDHSLVAFLNDNDLRF